MRFGSVCSGIEAASVAFGPLGWSAAWLAEIEPFPSAVLAHHYPDVPNLGDMTAIPRRALAGEIEAPDMLCGGTPCQAFSIAGLRESLSDERGNLTLKFVEIADAIDHVRARRGDLPAIVLWENVPGVLSTKDNAFGCFLAGLAGEDGPLEPPGGRWANAGAVYGPARAIAWRTLDAQYFGLAQRRRRVFVVASAREGFDPARVLFEWDSVRRDSAPSRGAWEGSTVGTLGGTSPSGGWRFGADEAAAGQLVCMAHGQGGAEVATERRTALSCNHEAPILAQFVTGDITHTLKAEGFDASEDGAGRGQPIVVHGTQNPCVSADTAFTLGRNNGGENVLAFDTTQITSSANYSNPQPGDPCHPLAAGAHPPAIAIQAGALRTNPASGPDGVGIQADHAYTLEARSEVQCVQFAQQVRRLTPRECERLQGFPDDYTRIPWRTYQEATRKGVSYETLLTQRGMTLRGPSIEDCPAGPRYKALGNSWAVPCVQWIGKRIQRHTEEIRRAA